MPCPSGTYSEQIGLTSESECTDCPEGTFCVAGSIAPINCTVGSFAGPRSTLCTPCERHTYQDEDRQGSCKPCPLGHNCPWGASVPLPAACVPGTYVVGNFTNEDDCTHCEPGYECPGGDSQPSLCRPGTVSEGPRTSQCQECSAPPNRIGSYQLQGGSTSCIDCIAGHYCPKGATTPLPCKQGSYSNSTSLTSDSECNRADPGFHAPTGSTMQFMCAAGTYTKSRAQGVCSRCPAGKYQDDEGQTGCRNCTAGHFCKVGAPIPFPCAAGTYGPHEGLGSHHGCLECPAGSRCIVGSARAEQCLPGSFAANPGSSDCTVCPSGSFATASGSTACTVCAPGHWCTSEAQIPCAQSTFNSRSGSFDQTDCIRCPERTTTQSDGSLSQSECSCAEGYFFATEEYTRGRSECTPVGRNESTPCCTCPIGARCQGGSRGIGLPQEAIAIQNLPIRPGYFRLSTSTVDVRRCPDSAANCSGHAECPQTASGCAGGNDENMCRPGLTGTFCRSCMESQHYYEPATSGRDPQSYAHCESCRNVAGSRSGAILITAGCVTVAILLGISVFYHLPVPKREFVNDAVQYLIEKQGIPTKIKIVIGFYQIATRVETVYGITLPEAVRKMMMLLRIAISFGIDGIPLACVGADGYHARLVFWTVVPLVVVFVVTCIGAAYALRRTLPCFRAASQSESKEPAKPKGKGQMGELGELILKLILLDSLLQEKRACSHFELSLPETCTNYVYFRTRLRLRRPHPCRR